MEGITLDFDRYPPNHGSVRGSRVRYSSIAAAIRDYGDTVDRIGPECGAIMHLRIDGDASSFEDRSLPVSALALRYNMYTLNPDAPGGLPDGWSLELSKVAPAFGRDGGAIQVKFVDDIDREVPLTDLRDLGLILK
jgi:hypothetical protein